MDASALLTLKQSVFETAQVVINSESTYEQLFVIVMIYLVAFLVSRKIVASFKVFNTPPAKPEKYPLRSLIYRCGQLVYPICAILLLHFSIAVSRLYFESSWVMHLAVATATLLLFYSFINVAVASTAANKALRWIGMPLLFLYLINGLDDVINVVDSVAISVGNIHVSVYDLTRTLLMGALLLWLGNASNSTGKVIIRRQQKFDLRTKELMVKMFEIGLFVLISLVLLQTMGIDLTAFAVLGGAIGVGIGFGLQSIASNFISGLIILFDRSLTIGDYVEMDDGTRGMVRQMDMRSTTLETYDGKDIVVPNEKFISSMFTNWTHKDKHQRYRVDFSVGYNTDVRSMVELIKEAVAAHPQVIAGEDVALEMRPDCEIDSFGDSGINMFVEFWMEGIDDGRNRVGGDLLLIILETLQRNGIEIPYPQREIRILNRDELASRH
ncbi:mechanosensitive ion channel family protein [Enterovibrio sp. 27052020O]|uniref:mechanosensitive ion channel family protein n=1 Tax=Enterovibrio sp. 27052020O TaxID=3241166 RepID=UPI00388EB2FA